jgi:hypothetical protein
VVQQDKVVLLKTKAALTPYSPVGGYELPAFPQQTRALAVRSTPAITSQFNAVHKRHNTALLYALDRVAK